MKQDLSHLIDPTRPLLSSAQVFELLKFLSDIDETDLDGLWWRDGEWHGHPDKLAFYILCNDCFYWACSDCVEIATQEDLELFKQCYTDCSKIAEFNSDWPLLYCARKRQMRPQGAMYQYIDKKLHHLFNEAGPEREVDFGNPKTQEGKYEFKN